MQDFPDIAICKAVTALRSTACQLQKDDERECENYLSAQLLRSESQVSVFDEG